MKWECKYHIVWVPKYRRKVLYGKLRSRLGEIIRELCLQHDFKIIEGHAMPDHIHCIGIPPKYSVANAIGFLKGEALFACIMNLEPWEWGSISGFEVTMLAQWD